MKMLLLLLLHTILAAFASCDAAALSNAATPVSCPPIISRAAWGARNPKSVSYLRLPVQYAFIHHTTGGRCYSQTSCAAKVRSFQNYHMDTNGWSDIGYSFIIGDDGNIYEGRGWLRVGAHTGGYNSVGFGIAFIGDFTSVSPGSTALSLAQRLIACGVTNGRLRTDYTIRGHRDMGATACPGTTLYNIIKKWPHY